MKENRPDLASDSALSEDAELSRSAVWAIRQKDDKVRIDTIEALAKALRVDPSWLAFGEDPERDVDPDDPYPNRARAIEAARLLGLPSENIGRVREMPGFRGREEGDEDPPPLTWFRWIENPPPAPRGEVVRPEKRPPPPRGRRHG